MVQKRTLVFLTGLEETQSRDWLVVHIDRHSGGQWVKDRKTEGQKCRSVVISLSILQSAKWKKMSLS